MSLLYCRRSRPKLTPLGSSQAYVWGRNDHHQITHPLPPHLTTAPSPDIPDTPTPAAPYPFPLASLPDSNVPAKLKAQQIATAAVGRNHTILVTASGEAWTAGWNNLGQCGQPKGEHASRFARVGGALLKEEVVAASAGISFSLFLTRAGTVYAVGTGEKGVLGNGRTGESIHASKVLFIEQDEPLLVGGALKDKKIVQITSGQYHSVALDDKGYCYSWGWGGLGRLGMGVQADCLVPTIIPSFAGAQALTRCAHISAGPACTLFIDNQGMTLLCGKWKNTGDGSSGQPWMMPKHVQDIQSIKIDRIAAGGVTLFCAKKKDKFDGDMLVGWGQGAIYGELGLGVGAVKSATKPMRLEAMNDIELVDMAAGQNTTYFIARPPATDSAVAEAGKPVEDQAATVPIPPVDASTEGAPTPAPAPTAAPGFDLSGFGFDFGPPKAASPAPVVAAAPAAPAADAGVSRTKAEAWEAFERYPPVLDAADECQVCGSDDPEFEALECEMVGLLSTRRVGRDLADD